MLPDGLGALVVTEGVGESRHLAVNDNGDIYVKLRLETGNNGNVALVNTNNDGKADSIERFGNYPNDGIFGAEMRIHNGYLYFSSEQVICRQKLNSTELIPKGNPKIILTDKFPQRWHNAKSLAFDNDGFMYVTFSAPTNACEVLNSEGKIKGLSTCPMLDVLRSIWKFDENKLGQLQTDGEMYVDGIRSIKAISRNKIDNSAYVVQHIGIPFTIIILFILHLEIKLFNLQKNS